MQQLVTPKHTRSTRARRLIWTAGGFFALLLVLIMTMSLKAGDDPVPGFEYTASQLSDETHRVSNDELVMLLMSLMVIIEVIVCFEYIRPIPCKFLLLSSFGAVVLSAFSTVLESFVLAEFLNYVEHIAYAAASILLAVWCGRVFAFRPRGDG